MFVRMRSAETFDALVRDNGMSQAQVARAAKVSPQFLSDVKRGTRRMYDLDARAVAKALGCSLGSLFDKAPDQSRKVR